MNKITALILMVLLVFGCIEPLSAFASAEETQPDCRIEGELLVELGVFKESELNEDSLSEKVTRGEFAEKLAVLLKKQSDEGNKVSFYDSQDMPEVNALAAAGIFKGNANGYFYPERNITKQEATIALIRALGYETYVSVRGGMTSEYVLLAKKLGLFSDFTLSEELSVAETAICLYNALMADVYEIRLVSDSGVTYTADGDNLLWILYKTVRVQGVVTADRFTGFYGPSSLAEDQLAINEKVYKTTIKEPWEYIGQNVIAFVKKDNGIETVNCIIPDEDRNEIITLYPGEFSYNNQVIEYEDKNGRMRTLTLPNSMVVIKNHQAVTENYDKVFDIKVGMLRLYKNEYISTGGYCVAVIDSAETAIVEAVDFAYNTIYTNKQAIYEIDCNKDGVRYIDMVVEPSGISVGVIQLKHGNLIEVYRSANGQYTKLHLCEDNIEGTITSILKKNDKTMLEINGEIYEASDGFVGTPEFAVGLTADFYFDTQGKIAHYVTENIVEGARYAYIYGIGKRKEAFEDKYMVKLFDENGQHSICEFAKKVQFDGNRVSAEQAYRNLTDLVTGIFSRQLVIFDTNESGEISYIDSAAADQASREADGTLWQVEEIGSYKYNRNLMGFSPQYPLRGNRTKVFVVPDEKVASPTEKHFAVRTFVTGDSFQPGRTYNVGFYKKTTTNPYMDVVLYSLADIPEYTQMKKLLIADTVYEVYDKANGETYVNMDCYVAGYKENINFAEVVSVIRADNKTELVFARDISNYIGQGDIMHYTENAVGEIARISILYDYDENKTSWGDEYSNYKHPNEMYKVDGLILADVDSVYRNPSSATASAMITVSKDGVPKEYISVLPAQFQAIVYDSSLRDNKFYMGTLDDLVSLEETANTECSKLFVQRSALVYTTFIIYK